jgi:exo-beta-1,3-glucanase (GH17 family)
MSRGMCASLALVALMGMVACCRDPHPSKILGDPQYRALSYGGYRENSRDIQPTMAQIKEDLKILSAMGVRVLRTYNVHYDETANLLQAIREMKDADSEFEMFVMMGLWIDAKNAWTDLPDRIRDQDSERNAVEIDRGVELANAYPDIVKFIAVGNEAMVHWAWNYHVAPSIILKWVRHLQALKAEGGLPKDVWITSSDNFASWGGGGGEYHNEDLAALIAEVDFISMHTYPMHDTHYNPAFWHVPASDSALTDLEKIESAMLRSRDYAISQYQSVVDYMKSLGINKPVHIGETGWATQSNELYGATDSRAVDEYKSARFHDLMREWSDANGVSVFYFIGFDENWKDAANPLGSENHFGLINLQAQAKFALWNQVDAGIFDGLTRDGRSITKTYDGNLDSLMRDVLTPPSQPPHAQ